MSRGFVFISTDMIYVITQRVIFMEFPQLELYIHPYIHNINIHTYVAGYCGTADSNVDKHSKQNWLKTL